ncbi:hypothetical protein MMPV_007707 [Pyropia vietnamensis]
MASRGAYTPLVRFRYALRKAGGGGSGSGGGKGVASPAAAGDGAAAGGARVEGSGAEVGVQAAPSTSVPSTPPAVAAGSSSALRRPSVRLDKAPPRSRLTIDEMEAVM